MIKLDTSNPVHLLIFACVAAIPSTMLGAISGAWAAMWRHRKRIDRIERWMDTVVSSDIVGRMAVQEQVSAEHRRDIEEMHQHAAQARVDSRDCIQARQEQEHEILRLLGEIAQRTARIEGRLGDGK